MNKASFLFLLLLLLFLRPPGVLGVLGVLRHNHMGLFLCAGGVEAFFFFFFFFFLVRVCVCVLCVSCRRARSLHVPSLLAPFFYGWRRHSVSFSGVSGRLFYSIWSLARSPACRPIHYPSFLSFPFSFPFLSFFDHRGSLLKKGPGREDQDPIRSGSDHEMKETKRRERRRIEL